MTMFQFEFYGAFCVESLGGAPGHILSADWPGWAEYCLTASLSEGDELLHTTLRSNIYLNQFHNTGYRCPAGEWSEHATDVQHFLHSFVNCAGCSGHTPWFGDILGANGDSVLALAPTNRAFAPRNRPAQHKGLPQIPGCRRIH
jgi:hypothetical protein